MAIETLNNNETFGVIRGKINENFTKVRDFVDPRDYGAVYDGVTDCAPAINQAIQAGDKVRLIGNGTALCSDSIICKSGTTLELDNEFTIKLADQVNKPLVVTPASSYKWDNASAGTSYLDNVTIRGGEFDLNGANQTRDFTNFTFVGFGIQIADVKNFVFEHSIITNPCSFGFQGGGLHGFRISNIICNYTQSRPNMDGIHINGDVYDGVIENISGTTNDDMIALNAFDGDEYMLRKGAMKRISIKNIFSSGSGYRGVRILNNDTQLCDEISIDGVYGDFINEAVLLSSYVSVPSNIGKVSISNVFSKSTGSSVIGVKNGGALTTVDYLKIDGVSYKQVSGNKSDLFYNEGTVKNCFINNVDIKTDDIDLSSVNLIRGSIIKNLFISNVYIEKPATAARSLYFSAVTFDRIFVNNSYIAATNFYRLYKNGGFIKEGNVIFDGTTRIDYNGFTVTDN
jgi:hypothetical protein